uniref:Leucine rich immune protein (Coil-less) n=1 Tax=Anopheles farauti TaxID=69004 RepID=A0A182Q750_9DIPT
MSNLKETPLDLTPEYSVGVPLSNPSNNGNASCNILQLFVAPLLLLLAPRTTVAFRFKCEYIKCTITNWTPSVEGTFLLDHIPADVFILNLLHLKTGSLHLGMLAKAVPILRTIDVRKSRMKSVTLPATTKLMFLWVRRTQLSEITLEKGNAQLELLGIAESRLKSVPATVPHLTAIKTLYITQSLIRSVDLNILGSLQRLELVDLSDNRIESIQLTNTTSDAFPRLQYLDFVGNRLVTVSLYYFNAMPALATLDFSNNRIVRVHGPLLSPTIRSLDLTHNHLSMVSCCGWQLDALTKLTVNDNRLQELPICMEEAMPNIVLLAVKSNALSNTDSWARLMAFRWLKVLDVSYNRLTSAVFRDEWVALEDLTVSHNRIRNLSVPFVRQDLYIDAACNLIEKFNPNGISRNVSILIMYGNPIDCSWNRRELEGRGKPVQCVKSETTAAHQVPGPVYLLVVALIATQIVILEASIILAVFVCKLLEAGRTPLDQLGTQCHEERVQAQSEIDQVAQRVEIEDLREAQHDRLEVVDSFANQSVGRFAQLKLLCRSSIRHTDVLAL